MNGDPASEAKVKFKGSNSRRIAYQVGGENNKNQKAIQYVVAHSPPIDNLSRVGGRTIMYHIFFEQSGTFKNELRKLGHEAYDYDNSRFRRNRSYHRPIFGNRKSIQIGVFNF